MNKLKRSDLLSLEEYNSNREQLRGQVLTLKKDRRVQIGSNVTLLFENTDTIKYQVQEKLKIEGERLNNLLSEYQNKFHIIAIKSISKGKAEKYC